MTFDYDKEITAEPKRTLEDEAKEHCEDFTDEELLQAWIDRGIQPGNDLREKLVDGLYEHIAEEWRTVR